MMTEVSFYDTRPDELRRIAKEFGLEIKRQRESAWCTLHLNADGKCDIGYATMEVTWFQEK